MFVRNILGSNISLTMFVFPLFFFVLFVFLVGRMCRVITFSFIASYKNVFLPPLSRYKRCYLIHRVCHTCMHIIWGLCNLIVKSAALMGIFWTPFVFGFCPGLNHSPIHYCGCFSSFPGYISGTTVFAFLWHPNGS